MSEEINYYIQKVRYESKSLLDKAVEKDPSYALAYVELGEANWQKWKRTKKDVWVDQAKAMYDRALSLDDSLPNLHYSLGLLYGDLGEHDVAVQLISKAIKINAIINHMNMAVIIT